MDEEIDLRDPDGGTEIDLTDRLRFAADALAADFSDQLTADYAEALVFSSAEGLLARASVTEFVPILAERRARIAVRSARFAVPDDEVAAPAPAVEPAPVAEALPVEMTEPVAETVAAPTNGSTAAPLMAVPSEELARLRDRVDQIRVRVSDWRAEQDRR